MSEASRERKKQYQKETRQWRKEHHICVTCGKQDAAIGFVQCGECIERKINEYYANKERHNATCTARKKRLQEAGLCVTCGKPRSEKSKVYCDKHLEKRRVYDKKRHRSKKVYMSIEREAEVRKIREEGLKKGTDASMKSPKAQEHRKTFGERQFKRIKAFFIKKG